MTTDSPDLQLPEYGQNTLADLSQSVLASLGVPGSANVLGLPEVSRACLLIVDGLGWDLLPAAGRPRRSWQA